MSDIILSNILSGFNGVGTKRLLTKCLLTKRLLDKTPTDKTPTGHNAYCDKTPTGHNAYWTKCLLDKMPTMTKRLQEHFWNVNIRKKSIKTIFRIIDLLKKIIGHSNKSLSIKVIHCDWKLYHKSTTILRNFHIFQYGNQISSSGKVGSWAEAWIQNLVSE